MSAIHRPPGRGGPCPGIIPARAGFTSNPRTARPDAPDHPRSRGVYRVARRPGRAHLGSSPLARGLRRGRPQLGVHAGIIPARAGFTFASSMRTRSGGDHPRSRGVYGFVFCSYVCSTGSSPLARGLREGFKYRSIDAGIIPARAGFTRSAADEGRPLGDHPRSRGVYAIFSTRTRPVRGSSPLARGLLDGQELGEGEVRIIPARAGLPHGWGLRQCCARIIPARAGFTTRADGPRRASGDHPRSRGVYPRVLAGCPDDRGSSPLARGLPVPGVGLLPGGGIIPARAGFTITHPLGRYIPEDHPRSRGVYMRRRRSSSTAAGSSPLARGLPVQ